MDAQLFGVRLGIDPGDARIGVASSDPSGILATPVEPDLEEPWPYEPEPYEPEPDDSDSDDRFEDELYDEDTVDEPARRRTHARGCLPVLLVLAVLVGGGWFGAHWGFEQISSQLA